VSKVGNEQALAVRVDTLKPDTAPAILVSVGRVNRDGHIVVSDLGEVELGSVLLVAVLDESPVGVGLAEELELLKEVGRRVGLLQLVGFEGGRARGVGQGSSAQPDDGRGHERLEWVLQ
jgi:hypothetical protein